MWVAGFCGDGSGAAGGHVTITGSERGGKLRIGRLAICDTEHRQQQYRHKRFSLCRAKLTVNEHSSLPLVVCDRPIDVSFLTKWTEMADKRSTKRLRTRSGLSAEFDEEGSKFVSLGQTMF